MMETQKIGYDGVLMFEVGGHGGDPVDVLKRCVEGARAAGEDLRHVLDRESCQTACSRGCTALSH